MAIAEQIRPARSRRPSASGRAGSSQVVTLVAVAVPPLGLLAGDGPAVGRRLPLVDLVAARRHLRRLRLRDDDRLPPLLHAPGFQARTPVKATLAILGCMTMQGPLTQWVTDHRKHHALSDKHGDPHSPHAGHAATAWSARLTASSTRTSAGCSAQGHGARREYGKDLLRGPARSATIDRLYLALGRPHVRDPVRDRLRDRRRRGRPASRRLVWGGAAARLPLPARHVQRELDLPHVRPPGLPRPATSRGTTGSSRCSSSARAGTTTITRSRPPRGTACAGPVSTSRGG